MKLTHNKKRLNFGTGFNNILTYNKPPMVMELTFDNSGTTFYLATSSTGIDIDWGDGNITQNVLTTEDKTHIYDTGIYDIKIYGDFSLFINGHVDCAPYVTKVKEWGFVYGGWRMFRGCGKLETLPSYEPPFLKNITSISEIFENCRILSSGLENWDVGHITNMSKTFYYCYNINTSNIGNWDVSNVTNMGSLFQMYGGNSDINFSNWDFSSVSNMVNFLTWNTLSVDNYDSLLISLTDTVTNTGVTLEGGYSKYSSNGEIAKNYLVNTMGWIINDAGLI